MADRDAESETGAGRDAVKTYECSDCGNRIRAEHQPGTCPNCGGEMLDISVTRE